MREIKFRAWDKDRRCFIPCIVGNTDIQDDKWICPLTFCEVNGVKDWYHNDTCDVMQYTGLYDKNGKDVYEGDIVRYISSNDEYRPEGDVQMDEGMWRVFWKRDETRSDENIRKDLYFWATEREIEVIGNIYENPELLEVD